MATCSTCNEPMLTEQPHRHPRPDPTPTDLPPSECTGSLKTPGRRRSGNKGWCTACSSWVPLIDDDGLDVHYVSVEAQKPESTDLPPLERAVSDDLRLLLQFAEPLAVALKESDPERYWAVTNAICRLGDLRLKGIHLVTEGQAVLGGRVVEMEVEVVTKYVDKCPTPGACPMLYDHTHAVDDVRYRPKQHTDTETPIVDFGFGAHGRGEAVPVDSTDSEERRGDARPD